MLYIDGNTNMRGKMIQEAGKTCPNCGCVFYRNRHCTDFTWKIKTYCCYKCSGEYSRKKQKGEV